jgi:hypothetical protein
MIAQLLRGAIMVNTARGDMIDEPGRILHRPPAAERRHLKVARLEPKVKTCR